LWKKLFSFCKSGFSMMNLNDLGISNQGDKVRFAAYGHLPPVDITGTVSGLLQQLQSFFAALPCKWADQHSATSGGVRTG
jgi:hypothetical protein